MSTTTLAAPIDETLARSPGQPLAASAEFKVGLCSVPYLADHGFHDMVVLPGAFYIELALNVDRELSRRAPGCVRNVTFENPVILAAADTVIRVEVVDHGDGRFEYAFYEGGIEESAAPNLPRKHAARLEIDHRSARSARAGEISIEAFQARSDAAITADRFYAKLRDNGNQYGPGFQKISGIWRAGDEALGRISVKPEDRESGPRGVHPSLLDAMVQLLASFTLKEGRTFVLRSIERIEVLDLEFPGTVWGCAKVHDRSGSDGKTLTGDVRIFDQAGKDYLTLSGIRFAFLDRADALLDRADAPIDRANAGPERPVDAEAAGDGSAANIVIASNFTAEPLEDSLKFWGDYFGVPTRIEFAPYNQVFQQLLDSGKRVSQEPRRHQRHPARPGGMGRAIARAALTLSIADRADRCFGDRRALRAAERARNRPSQSVRDGLCLQGDLRGSLLSEAWHPPARRRRRRRHRRQHRTLFAVRDEPLPERDRFTPSSRRRSVYELLKANCEAYGGKVHAVNMACRRRAQDCVVHVLRPSRRSFLVFTPTRPTIATASKRSFGTR